MICLSKPTLTAPKSQVGCLVYSRTGGLPSMNEGLARSRTVGSWETVTSKVGHDRMALPCMT